MATNAPWNDPAGPLKSLAAKLGIDPKRLHGNEAPDKLNLTELKVSLRSIILDQNDNVDQQKLTDMDNVLRDVWVKYNSALTLQFKVGAEKLIIDGAYDKTRLEEFFNEIKDSPHLEAQLIINKDQLLTNWGLADPGVTFKMYLFPEALQSALGVPLVNLEQADPDHSEEPLLKDFNGESKLIILVPDHPIELNGDYLAVLGGDAVARTQNYKSSKKPTERLQLCEFVNKQARDKLKWVHVELNLLTPLQFKVAAAKSGDDSEPPKDDPIAGALYAQSLACSLLYMAAHSSWKQSGLTQNRRNGRVAQNPAWEHRDSSWVATFAAAKGVVSLRIGDAHQLKDVLVSNSTGSPWKTSQTIADLATWIYEQERDVGNRLIVVQHILVSTLEDNEPSQALSQFVRRASEVAKRVEWGWDAFIGDKLESYFSREKELEETIESTTKAYNEQVQTMTKTLIDNMLAAVGVVVGSFIAAIFKSPFQEYVFWVAIGIYTAYLVIFPISVGLTSTWQRFSDSSKSFRKRKEDFKQRLTDAQVEQIVGDTVTKREWWFTKWFGVTTVLYLVVLGLMIVAMFVVPSRIKRWGDDFALTDISYGGSPNSNTVSIIIRGDNFDKDKEIVVKIGSLGFTNTDDQTLKVHGSTVLTLAPQQEDFANFKASGGKFVSIMQGGAGPKELSLPVAPAPIPDPKFDLSTLAQTATAWTVQGNNFESIAAMELAGTKLNFTVSDAGRKLEFATPNAPKKLQASQVLKILLKNGQYAPDVIL